MWGGHSCPPNAESATNAKRKPAINPKHLAQQNHPGRGPGRKRLRPRRSSRARRPVLQRPRPVRVRAMHAERWQTHTPPRNHRTLHPPPIHARRQLASPRLGYSLQSLAIRKTFFAALLRSSRLHRNFNLDRSHKATVHHPAHQPHLARLRESGNQTNPPEIP